MRLLLDRIGGKEINKENDYWKLNIGDYVFCDYVFVNNQLTQLGIKEMEDDQMCTLLNIVSPGKICPDIQTEWMDDSKKKLSMC